MSDAEIYAEVRTALMRYATALVGVSDAADVVSAVVTRAVARPGGLEGLDDPRPYLMRAILNEVRMRHRSKTRQVRAMSMVSAEAIRADHDHVLDAVMALPPQQRAAVFLTYYEQYTAPEIANVMGCRPATVRRYLHLARNKLKEVFDE